MDGESEEDATGLISSPSLFVRARFLAAGLISSPSLFNCGHFLAAGRTQSGAVTSFTLLLETRSTPGTLTRDCNRFLTG